MKNKLLLSAFLISLFFISCSYKTEDKEELKIQSDLQNTAEVTIKLDESKDVDSKIQNSISSSERLILPKEEDIKNYRRSLIYELSYYKGYYDVSLEDNNKMKCLLDYESLINGFTIDGLTAEMWTFELKGMNNEKTAVYCRGRDTQTLRFGNNNNVYIKIKDMYDTDVEHRYYYNGYVNLAIYSMYNLSDIEYWFYKYNGNENSSSEYVNWLQSLTSGENNCVDDFDDFTVEASNEIPQDVINMGVTREVYPDTGTFSGLRMYTPTPGGRVINSSGLIEMTPGIYLVKLVFKSKTSTSATSTETLNVVQLTELFRIMPNVTINYNTVNKLNVSKIEYNLNGGEWSEENEKRLTEKHYDMCVTGNRKYLDLEPEKDYSIFEQWELEDSNCGWNIYHDDEKGFYLYGNDGGKTIKLIAAWKD